MDGGQNGEMGFGNGGAGVVNRPSLGMNTSPLSEKVGTMTMGGSMSMYNCSSGKDQLFSSGWDSIVSLSQSGNLGCSSLVSHTEFPNPSYAMQNEEISCASQFVQYPSESSLVELVPKLQSFGSGSFLEMVGSFCLPFSSQIANTGSPPNRVPNKEAVSEMTSINGAQTQEDRQISEEDALAASPNGKRRQVADSNSNFLQNKDISGGAFEVLKKQEEKKRKTEENKGPDFCSKRTGKNPKENCHSEDSKENYIHVRARRGQATNSHSLAERVRREKISERMRLLQELVPGCNKITGKAVMLDEIINYVQSLQQQVEFLSMKLANVNPELNIDLDRIISKELHSGDVNAATLRFGPVMSSSAPYPHGSSFQGSLPGISIMTPHYPSLSQAVLDDDFQNLFPMVFDSSSAFDTSGSNGRLKLEQ